MTPGGRLLECKHSHCKHMESTLYTNIEHMLIDHSKSMKEASKKVASMVGGEDGQNMGAWLVCLVSSILL